MDSFRIRNVAALAALGLLLLLPACSSGGGGEEASGPAVAGSTQAGREAAGGGSTDGSPGRLATSVPEVGPQIIKTASLRLGIPHGRFEDKIDEASRIATTFGGFVVSSSASQGSERRLVEGTLVLRVPASNYDEAKSQLRQLGKVESLEENGEDVSQQFVDLRARERQLQAVEAQLLELLKRANDVPAALAVQNQLSQVQLELEQARGRLQYLDDQVAFATVSLSIHELGVAPPKDEGFSIVDAWATAGSAFLTVVGWIFVGLAVIAPIVVILGLGFLGARELRKRLAQA